MKFTLLTATAIGLVAATSAAAQTGATTNAQNTAPTNGPGMEAPSSVPEAQTYPGDIVVTAQRQSQRLQDVPIAVAAFTADNLDKQQIPNPLALQQTLPNTTFTKGNFGTNTFTIRGIGDLCVGVTCDSATGIHLNEMPVGGTRILEGEFYDIERIEVLRGPQGTLFGRNATSGVVDIITAKTDLSGIHAAGEFEYGNYDSKRVRAMVNVPFTDTLGVRVAGYYLNRDGYMYNTYTDSRFDGRDMWSVRGTLTWEPTSDTRIDLIAQIGREDDDRSRLQKQLCDRDSTGVLGCLPTGRGYGTTNFNSTLGGATESAQGLPIFLADVSVPLATSNPAYVPTFIGTLNALRPTLAPFGLGSVGSPGLPATPDNFSNAVNPRDVRTVTVDYLPTWFTKDEIYMVKFYQNFGKISLNVTGGHT